MEKRNHPRMVVQGITADVSDGRGFYTATLEDISRFGLSLSDLPARVNKNSDKLTVVFAAGGVNYKLVLKLRWEQVNGLHKTIGGLIDKSPWKWTDYVMKQEPETEDIWGT